MSSGLIVEKFDDLDDLAICKEVADTLWSLFPGYQWATYPQDHNIIIRHLPMFAYDPVIFLNRKDIPYHSREKLKPLLLKYVGEFLERSNLSTGALREGDVQKPLEGMKTRLVSSIFKGTM